VRDEFLGGDQGSEQLWTTLALVCTMHWGQCNTVAPRRKTEFITTRIHLRMGGDGARQVQKFSSDANLTFGAGVSDHWETSLLCSVFERRSYPDESTVYLDLARRGRTKDGWRLGGDCYRISWSLFERRVGKWFA
jgi:hypothetical protein